jgi:hypothetical protein
MSQFRKYLEIVQEGMLSSAEFTNVLKNQNDKMMDYIVVYGLSEDLYVCDDSGKYCDPTDTTVAKLYEMITQQTGESLTYTSDFESDKSKKMFISSVVKNGVEPFEGCMITIVKNKK